jgi:hypothetical protein
MNVLNFVLSVASLGTAIILVYWGTNWGAAWREKRLWALFVAGSIFFESLRELGTEIIRWLNR